MKVLVTGGAGFIGSHIVRALIYRGDTVRVLDNFSTGKRENLGGLDVEILEGDILDVSAVQQAIRGMTHVVHLAAFVSVPGSIADPLTCNSINVTGTLNILHTAADQGVRRIVFASSSAVYGDRNQGPQHEDLPLYPLSPYGLAKLAAEKFCCSFHTLYGTETVILRYFNVFGPRQNPQSDYAAVIPRFISAVLYDRQPVIYGDGEQTRDFVYVANIVKSNLLALETPAIAGQIFNIASGEPVSINQLAQTLGEVSGRKVKPQHMAPRDGDIRHSSADTTRARTILGYAPSVSLSEGLALTLRWYQETTDARFKI
jgi:UDP-glucose 4-epimerase